MSWDETTLGTCRLVCATAEAVLPTLPDASVQLILVDPPYMNTKLSYAGERLTWDRQWPTREAYLAWLLGLAKEWRRILAPNGSLYCFASPQMAAWVEVTLSDVFQVLNRIQWLKDEGWHKKTDPSTLRAYCSPREEILFCEQVSSETVAMGEAGYTQRARQLHTSVFAPLGQYIQQERERAGVTRDQVDVGLGYIRTKNPCRGTELCRRWEEGSSLPTQETYDRLRTFLNTPHGQADYLRREYEDLRRPFTLSPTVPYTDVWTYATVPTGPDKHPCEKPLSLLRHMILASSRPGDLVLDCFMGSGSTLDAAKQCGRQAIGVEQDPRWYRQACARVTQEHLWQAPPPQQRPTSPAQEQLL